MLERIQPAQSGRFGIAATEVPVYRATSPASGVTGSQAKSVSFASMPTLPTLPPPVGTMPTADTRFGYFSSTSTRAQLDTFFGSAHQQKALLTFGYTFGRSLPVFQAMDKPALHFGMLLQKLAAPSSSANSSS